MDNQEQHDQVLEDILEMEETEEQEDGLIHLSTGVVLETQPIPRLFTKNIYTKYESIKPKVPKFYNEQKNREEENPADGDYIDALEAWGMQFMFDLTELAIMRGTKIHTLPKDIEGPYGEYWVEETEHFGIKIPNAPKLRYLYWIQHVAAPLDEDAIAIGKKVRPLLGITEEAVEQEMRKFRSDEEPSTDLSSGLSEHSGNGDRNPDDTGIDS